METVKDFIPGRAIVYPIDVLVMHFLAIGLSSD
jgi:hypothetical protein